MTATAIKIPWTDEQDSALIRLAREGLSHSEIGRRLGTTRNSTLGRLKRLRDAGRDDVPEKMEYEAWRARSGRQHSVGPDGKLRKRTEYRCAVALIDDLPLFIAGFSQPLAPPPKSKKIAATPVVEKRDPGAPPSLRTPFLDRRGMQCSWIDPVLEGDDPDVVTVCGHPISRGSYCAYHAGIVYAGRPK